MDTNKLFNDMVNMTREQAKQALCTHCDEPVPSVDYDPYNGGEIQQCIGCAESANERQIEENSWSYLSFDKDKK